MNPTLKSLRRCLFLISMPMVFITFGLPLRAEDLGASGFEIGLLFSIFTASLIIIRPIVGIGLDQFGRRYFFITAMSLYFAASALYAFGDTISGLFIARTIHGVAFAFLIITADTITADVIDHADRSAAMGSNIASQSRGGMLGAMVGFTLIGFMPIIAWQMSFAIYASIAAIAVIIAYATIPETLGRDHRQQDKTKFTFDRKYYRLLFIIFFAAFAAAIIAPYYLVYLRGKFGLEAHQLAAVFLPVGLTYALLPGWLGKITGSLNRALVVALGLTIAAAMYTTVPFIDSFLGLIGVFVAASIGAVLVDLTKNAWIADIAGASTAGRNFGLAAFAAGMGAATGPLIGGYLFDNFGKESIFYAGAAVFIFTALLALPYTKQTSEVTN